MTQITPAEIRNLAHVNRWAITPTTRNQSVAEHSYYVAVYAKMIAELENFEDVGSVVLYALEHDWDETFTGDIPSPVKTDQIRKYAASTFANITGYDMKKPTHEVRTIVKLADMLEGAIFLHEQIEMGNNLVTANFSKIINEIIAFFDENRSFFKTETEHCIMEQFIPSHLRRNRRILE